ncbi:MAG: hypothetical protein EAX89_11645 [Candidatus Lokiarchaeota archaeon]|nr:hypothetical protein [Candidatus Lokiarchaeota archaeon]
MRLNLKFTYLMFTILLSLVSNLSLLQQQSFTIGVKKNEEFVWNCNVCNSIEMEEIFGSSWDNLGFFENLSLNRKMKWKINLIESNTTSLIINVNSWVWKESDNWGIEDKNLTIFHYAVPSDYGNNLNYTSSLPFIPIWFPVPVGDYMGELSFSDIYDIDNRVLATININMAKSKISFNYPSKSISIIAIYNSKGILSSYKLYIEENIVIMDIALVDLPFYTIPSTIGLISAFLISIGIYIYFKRKNRAKE